MDEKHPSERRARLTPAFKKAWVEALESGEYKQARGRLQDQDRCAYCCLGVGALISGVDENWIRASLSISASTSKDWFLPGHKYGGLWVFYQGNKWFLWELNDIHQLSFKEIAALIRGQL